MGIVGRDGGMKATGRAECVCCSFWFLGDGLEVLSVKDKEIGRLLIATNLTKSHSAGTVAMGLLDTAGGWGGLAGSLCCKLLAWSFSSCGSACGLLGSCHGACGCGVKSIL